jgi:hypothetical protein
MKTNLRLFIELENQRRRDINRLEKRRLYKLVTVPTCLEDSQWITDQLNSQLSDECLSQDGELSPEEAQERETYLLAVHTELEELINEKIPLEEY